jgi:hypothetical protein
LFVILAKPESLYWLLPLFVLAVILNEVKYPCIFFCWTLLYAYTNLDSALLNDLLRNLARLSNTLFPSHELDKIARVRRDTNDE